MSFWTSPQIEPIRKYRFQIQTPTSYVFADQWWWAKSIEKPSYEFNTAEYQLTNHKFKFPGILTWNDISITIVDDNSQTTSGGSQSNRAFGLMSNLSYIYRNPKAINDDQGAKEPSINGSITQIIINQVDAEGKTLEKWTLHDAFVKSVSFGDLAYADDELVEITLGISYDYATLE